MSGHANVVGCPSCGELVWLPPEAGGLFSRARFEPVPCSNCGVLLQRSRAAQRAMTLAAVALTATFFVAARGSESLPPVAIALLVVSAGCALFGVLRRPYDVFEPDGEAGARHAAEADEVRRP